MTGQRSLVSEYDDDSSRCQKTNGRRWRCPMPAQPNKSFCSHHKTPPSSLHQNPSRSLDRRKTGPGESEEDSEHGNFGSDKKRRRKAMAVSDLVAEKSLNPVDASTEKHGSKKKKKIERSGNKQVSDSLSSDKGEADLVIEKGNLSSDPVKTIRKKGERTKKKLVDSNYLLNSEDKSESRAESEVEKLENCSDKAADVVIDLGPEEVAMVLDLVNADDSVNQRDKSSDVKIGIGMDQQTDIDNLNMLDPKINKEKTTTRGDMDNFEVSSVKEIIIETDSGLVKINENVELVKVNENVDQNVGMLETSKNKERGKVGVLEVQELEKSSEIVAGIEENTQRTSGYESYDVSNKNIIDSGDPEGPKLSQKVQRGTATGISEDLTGDEHRSSSIQCTDYMFSQLPPVLKLLNWEQVLELGIEAKNQGKDLAGVRVQTIEYTQDMQYKCKFCRASIVNLLRGCSNCCYKLCLSCCQEIRGKNLLKEEEIMASGYATKQKRNDPFAETHHRKKKRPFSSKTGDEQIPCPPTGLGGCGQEVLVMKLLLPHGMLESIVGDSNRG